MADKRLGFASGLPLMPHELPRQRTLEEIRDAARKAAYERKMRQVRGHLEATRRMTGERDEDD